MRRFQSFLKGRSALVLLAGLLMAPCLSAAPAKTAKAAAAKPAPVKPAGPDDLTAPSVRHLVACPPPKIAACVMKRPIAGGYSVLTKGVEIADDGVTWIVDFGKGQKASPFLLQVLDTGGSLHDIEVSFRTKPGMQKTPTLPEE
ncbi:MAG TPA: hypothetical protein VF801_07325 [Rhodocyclaceae bacterium]